MINSVRIAGHPYQIMWMPEDWTTDTGLRGQCDPDQLRIRIAKGQPVSRTMETLWHEIGHGVFHEYGVDHVDKSEEAVNSLYMSGLYQVIMDNPHLINFQQNVLE